MTGDVVNTASRLQGAAPVGGVAVSEQTYRQTERVFDYEPLEPVAVKGKTEPLAIFRPLQARARFGTDVTRTHTTPLVGRELEKPLLIGTFERAAQQRSCQLVTVLGEPGVGKSRLCAELFAYIEERPGLVRWRQGRCLPYGEGIAYWALGEIVKAECGILESDSPEQAAAKLERALPADDPDLPWLQARLAPLVGVVGRAGRAGGVVHCLAALLRVARRRRAGGVGVRGSALGRPGPAGVPRASGRLGRGRAAARPVHGTAGAVRTARELGGRAAQRDHDQPAPLSEQETARLIALAARAGGAARETQQRCSSAPAAILCMRRSSCACSPTGAIDAESVEVPESVQALIAARLDTLAPDRKSLLQDAAVVGKVFWAGAVAAMGRRDVREVEQALHELAHKELVRPSRTTSMEAEAEYGFWHGLVRDVCYGQIPRAARAARHEAAAVWMEQKAGERVEDLADVLAHHYLSALELTRAAGQIEKATTLEAHAIRYLTLAGERALALDVDRAEQSLAQALALAQPGHPERAFLLERWAQTAQQQGRLEEAKTALEEALALYRGRGESVDAGRVLIALAPYSAPRRPTREGDDHRSTEHCSMRNRPARNSSPPTPR